MPKELKGVELFGVGVWNQMPFKQKDLESIERSYKAFTGVLRVPLKLGHNEEQPMTDGQPALGWVGNVRLAEDKKKLLGDFTDLPEVVYKAIEGKLYNSLSIELAQNVDYKGSRYQWVLEGVALLGADLPAVNTISDLSKYLDAGENEKPVAMSRLSFSNSTTQKQIKEESQMTVDIEEFNKLKLEFSKLQNQKEQDTLNFEAEKAKLEEEKTRQVFSIKKESLASKLESLVASKAITPAQRDVFSKKIVENDLSSVELVSSLAETFTAQTAPTGNGAKFSRDSKEGADSLAADKEIAQRSRELRNKSGGVLSFKAACQEVMKADPKLAKEYINLTREV